MKKTCDCKNVTMGGYENQIHVAAPVHMPKDNGYCLDRCVADEVQHLWTLGITTNGCCCAHNIADVDPWIGVEDKDIQTMKELGYKNIHNVCFPLSENFFFPKSMVA